MGSQGPAALPGTYSVNVSAGDKSLSGTVSVALDPGVAASPADLEAQLKAAFEVAALQSRVNTIVMRVDDLLAQLNGMRTVPGTRMESSASETLRTAAIARLQAFRDEQLARPIAGLGYRQYPRLREDVQALAGYINRGFRAPNEGEKTRLADLTKQVADTEAAYNALVNTEVARVNEAMKGLPRIAAEPIR
jgi:hypothetical protein